MFFGSCQKQSPEDQAMKKELKVQDSLQIDSTKANINEKSYPPEPEGYKGIHQEEKEKYDQQKK